MRYFGGKQRISKPLSDFVSDLLEEGQAYVEPFCGSCNVISKINKGGIRIANDIHPELIAFWRHLQEGGDLPSHITKEDYYRIREGGEPWLRGFVGFGCSFAGKWWGGYAKGGKYRNYCLNAKNSSLKKIKTMQDVIFYNEDYRDLSIPEGALIYCDIPYRDSVGYSSGAFDHDLFYKWARGKNVLVSEYLENTPKEAKIVWEYRSKKDIRNGEGIQSPTTEVLFHL